MRPYNVYFIDHRLSSTMVLDGGYKLKPRGRLQWLQRLAWRFLEWRRALDTTYREVVEVSQHRIDADTFMERIALQNESLLNAFNREGKQLLIGSEDYAEMMHESVSRRYFAFNAEVGRDRTYLGLKVTVVPWMKGMVVMP